jgi:hypothetical protein
MSESQSEPSGDPDDTPVQPGVHDWMDVLFFDPGIVEAAISEAVGECQNVTVEYKSNVVPPGRNAKETATCDFLVCGKETWEFGLLPPRIVTILGKWMVVGFCDYRCAGSDCCCGTNKVWSFSVTGEGLR